MSDIIKEWNKKIWEITIDKLPVYRIIQDYKKWKIYLKPAYQRIYKWNKEQKSKLIESIFLGIPLPSIFIYWESKTSYEIVDGLQRISTILEFLWVLKSNNTPWSYLSLENYIQTEQWKEIFQSIKKIYREIDDLKDKRIWYLALWEFKEAEKILEYIQKLEDKIEQKIWEITKNKKENILKEKLKNLKKEKEKKIFWEIDNLSIAKDLNNKNFDKLSEDLKNDFMYKYFNFTVLNPSDSDRSIKYELFYRLNSWGTNLTYQEIRSALLLYLAPELYNLLIENSNVKYYWDLLGRLAASEDQKNLEYILRFYSLIYSDINDKSFSVQKFIDDYMWNVIEKKVNFPNKKLFENTMKLVFKTFWKDSLKRFKDNKFTGIVMVPAFDAIAWWIWYNLKEWNIPEDCSENNECIEEIKKRIKALWMSKQWNEHIKTWWFVEHKLQVAMFIWRKLFNLKENFWETEEKIAENIDELIDLEFNK